jgi:hypothetical protein
VPNLTALKACRASLLSCRPRRGASGDILTSGRCPWRPMWSVLSWAWSSSWSSWCTLLNFRNRRPTLRNKKIQMWVFAWSSWWSYLTLLLWFFSKLFLIFSHLFSLYSDYSYLFLLNTNVGFTLWNPVPKVTFRNRRPTLRNKKNQNYFFVNISMLECLFLWYMSDLDLWLSVMSCGVMSTIISAYTYRHKYK